jgi:glycosyltransferase involved in cell wall biosynthesis
MKTPRRPPSARSPRIAETRVVFTIVSANYIGYAATLMQSVRDHHPEARRFIVLADSIRDFPDIDLAATVIGCDQLGIELLDNMKFWYSIMEFNTAIKPFCFQYFFKIGGAAEVCYIDPDILLFSPMTDMFAALAKNSCVLTPHMMEPLQDGCDPSDLAIMKAGIYNLGFLALRRDADATRLLAWWADRLFLHCRVDIAANMFTDQRWMDLAPAFVEKLCILRHPGYNVAYWNLPGRRVQRAGELSWTVNGQPLVFFHFSGIAPDNPTQFSKHQNRYTIANLGCVADLCALYRERVLANKWLAYSTTPYAFGMFGNGRPIEPQMRRWVLRAVDEGILQPREPLRIDPGYFDEIDTQAAAKGAVLTRFMYQFWLDRKDLRDGFDIYRADRLAAYIAWFLEDSSVKRMVDGRSIEAAGRLRPEPESEPRPPAFARPPWPAVSLSAWHGPASNVDQFLSGTVKIVFADTDMVLPKQIALMWERRIDLQTHFPISGVEDLNRFIAWAVCQPLTDGGSTAQLLTGRFAEQFNAVSAISDYYDDVPITTGMMITSLIPDGRTIGHYQQFPIDRASRMAHGLWFAFMAPRLFGWPEVLGAPVRAYFQAPTDIELEGYRLSRGVLAIWEMRSDVRQSFPLSDERSIWRYLRWLAMHGLEEFGLIGTQFDPNLVAFVTAASPRYPELSRLLEMAYDLREDLRAMCDITSAEGRAHLRHWGERALMPECGKALFPPANPVQIGEERQGELRAKIAITGYWRQASGLGEDLRCSASSFQAVGFRDYVVIDIESRSIFSHDGDLLDPLAGLRVDVNIVHTNADTAYEDWRLLRAMGVTAKRVIGFWMWELERLPSYWRYAYSFYDEVWGATEFTAGAFAAENLRPVKLVPSAVLEPQRIVTPARAKLDVPEDACLFLFMFDFRSYASRKNPDAVIAAFKDAFPAGDERVVLFIKTQGGAAMPAAWNRLSALATDTRIQIRDIKLDRDDLLSLVETSNAFISLHRSEGLGRGPAEAMLLGVPVIASDYSGTADFITADRALLVPCRLVPVDPLEYTGVEQQRWADPDIGVAADHMRWVYENPARARELGLAGRAAIRDLYGAERVGEAMLDALRLDQPALL